MSISRIALGTAQLGMRYGIANSAGQIALEEARSLLCTGWDSGIRMLDTAVLYGESESTLGRLGTAGWQIISKLPGMPDTVTSPAQWVREELSASLSRLRVNALHGLLLHRPAQLLGPHGEALYRAIAEEREQGRVSKIGISIYAPEELEALPRAMRFDIVQAPWNVLDQRMTCSGWGLRLQAEGCDFHARSVFLQGVLLMPPSARPPYFRRWHALFDAWDAWLAENEVSPLQACLQHALAAPGIARVVVGVDSAAHLGQILSAASDVCQAPALPAEIGSEDPALLNPANWSTA